MPLFEIQTENPDKKIHINTDSRELADKEFNALKEMIGWKEGESKIVSYIEKE